MSQKTRFAASIFSTLFAAFMILSQPFDASAAQTVHLYLNSNGERIEGESQVPGREGSIECSYFANDVNREYDINGTPLGARTYEPIVIRKRIDKATPLIAKALVENEVIEAKILFDRETAAQDPQPTINGGTTEQFFTIEIAEGRVASIRRVSPDTIDPAFSTLPPTEEVAIVFNKIRIRYEPANLEYNDGVTTRTPTMSGVLMSKTAAPIKQDRAGEAHPAQ